MLEITGAKPEMHGAKSMQPFLSKFTVRILFLQDIDLKGIYFKVKFNFTLNTYYIAQG